MSESILESSESSWKKREAVANITDHLVGAQLYRHTTLVIILLYISCSANLIIPSKGT